ncbi:MAG: hypothetical protein ACE5GK_05365 [Nitrospiria bacterium]
MFKIFSPRIFFLASPLLLALTAGEVLAIHAIIEDAEPIPRVHGPVRLGMPMEVFLQNTLAKEAAPAIGQFEDERRFLLDSLSSSSGLEHGVDHMVCDFFQGVLFRIEINYEALGKNTGLPQALIDQWTLRYGSPRENTLPDIRLIFWDDGATRMILQIERLEDSTLYSLTYIDDDLFHKISRDRVQRETGGESSYGK